jgi:hypothetical protein
MRFHHFLAVGIVGVLAGQTQAIAILPSMSIPPAAIPATEPRLGQIDFRDEEPVGQLAPDRPIRIDVINGGDATVTFELTQPRVLRRELPPQGEISFGTTHTSYLPPPVYLLAYPSDPEIGINLYIVSVVDNVVEVVVSEQISDIPGDRTIEITPTGAVYAY